MTKSLIAASALALSLFAAGNASAICGDVTGDGKKNTSDALAVLRSAVGQPVDLMCESGPSLVSYYNDFKCGVDDTTPGTASFGGHDFEADPYGSSPYQEVSLTTLANIMVSDCNGDYEFPGPIYLPPNRKISFFVIIADPDYYDFSDFPAFITFYDDGEEADAAATASDRSGREIAYAAGERIR